MVLFALEATGLCLLTAIFRQRLVETEADLGRVFEDSPIGILIIERGAQILKANPAFQQTLRADKVRLEGRSLPDLVHPDSRERVRTFLEHLIQQQAVGAAEDVCLVGDTTTAWANLRGSWIREERQKFAACMVTVRGHHRAPEDRRSAAGDRGPARTWAESGGHRYVCGRHSA